jgi:hypothetical protein
MNTRTTKTFSKGMGTFRIESEAYTEDGKVWRWSSNDAPVPLDAAAEYFIPIDPAAQQAARDAYVTASIAEYRRNYTPPNAEQRAEARAAHGPGVKLVDVLSGHTWTT